MFNFISISRLGFLSIKDIKASICSNNSFELINQTITVNELLNLHFSLNLRFCSLVKITLIRVWVFEYFQLLSYFLKIQILVKHMDKFSNLFDVPLWAIQ